MCHEVIGLATLECFIGFSAYELGNNAKASGANSLLENSKYFRIWIGIIDLLIVISWYKQLGVNKARMPTWNLPRSESLFYFNKYVFL